MGKKSSTSKASNRCAGTTKKGAPCRNKIPIHKRYCNTHETQKKSNKDNSPPVSKILWIGIAAIIGAVVTLSVNFVAKLFNPTADTPEATSIEIGEFSFGKNEYYSRVEISGAGNLGHSGPRKIQVKFELQPSEENFSYFNFIPHAVDFKSLAMKPHSTVDLSLSFNRRLLYNQILEMPSEVFENIQLEVGKEYRAGIQEEGRNVQILRIGPSELQRETDEISWYPSRGNAGQVHFIIIGNFIKSKSKAVEVEDGKIPLELEGPCKVVRLKIPGTSVALKDVKFKKVSEIDSTFKLEKSNVGIKNHLDYDVITTNITLSWNNELLNYLNYLEDSEIKTIEIEIGQGIRVEMPDFSENLLIPFSGLQKTGRFVTWVPGVGEEGAVRHIVFNKPGRVRLFVPQEDSSQKEHVASSNSAPGLFQAIRIIVK